MYAMVVSAAAVAVVAVVAALVIDWKFGNQQ
jgi:hypothetical protein